MTTAQLSLQTDIARQLSTELGDSGMVTCRENQVTVVISLSNCEGNFGTILQRIHRVIDEYYPERSENIFIRVRDESGTFQHVMKIWKPV